MTLTSAQIREARALLGWTTPKLSRVGFDKVLKAQDDDGIASVSGLDLRTLRNAFETAGVRFVVDADGKPGAELRTSRP